MIDIGTKNVSNVSISDKQVAKIFLGNIVEPVWQNLSSEYLTFIAKQAGSTIGLDSKNATAELKYSTDQSTWTELNVGDEIILSNVGDKVYFKGISTSYTNSTLFEMTGKIAARGSVMSILWGDDFKNHNDLPHNRCCISLFYNCASLTTAPELPATTLAEGCYCLMFDGCTSLVTAPELPATTLAEGCYEGMFEDCTSLVTAPELPATTLAEGCYEWMFFSCTSLTQAPELPATTLAEGCYDSMFAFCTSLTQAPELPATTLAGGCYGSMFAGCTSLTQAPELPAEDLLRDDNEAWYCYSEMFTSCTSLTIPPELPATTLAEGCYEGMFYNCTSLTALPELPAEDLSEECYYSMFESCTNIKISETQTGKYQIPYRIPTTGDGIDGEDSLTDMFLDTGGTFVGTPEINTTYYLCESD